MHLRDPGVDSHTRSDLRRYLRSLHPLPAAANSRFNRAGEPDACGRADFDDRRQARHPCVALDVPEHQPLPTSRRSQRQRRQSRNESSVGDDDDLFHGALYCAHDLVDSDHHVDVPPGVDHYDDRSVVPGKRRSGQAAIAAAGRT